MSSGFLLFFAPPTTGSTVVTDPTILMPGALTVETLVTDVLREMGVVAPDAVPGELDAAFTLRKLNRLIDNWNADPQASYAATFATQTLTPNLNPHTIGPTGTFLVPQRPVSIDGANLILPNGVRVPIDPIDRIAYGALRLPTVATTIPKLLYYEPKWPNGEINLYPVPPAAYGLELLSRIAITQVLLTDRVWFPPGYLDAIMLTLIEDCCPTFEKAVHPKIEQRAREARARIFGNNVHSPNLVTRDAGMPSGRRRGGFNYLTGEVL